MITQINRLNDFYFKYLMGSERNKHIALNFINAALATDKSYFTDIIYVNKDQEPQNEAEKESRLDVKGVLNDGSVVELEMQAIKDVYMPVRSLYYWSRMYGSELETSKAYKELKPTVSINILGYELDEEKSWHNEYRVLNVETHRELTNHLRIIFLDLVKFEAGKLKEMSDLELWGAFFSRKLPDKVLKEVQVMADAMIAEDYFTADDTLRYKYEQREKFLRDQKSLKTQAWEEGKAEGIEEGRAEGRVEAQINAIRSLMDSLDLTPEKAMQALKLTAEEQEELLPLI